MKYLLHSSTIADFLSGQPHVMARLKSTPPIDIGIATPTILEFRYAFIRRPDRSIHVETVFNALIGAVSVIDFAADDAAEAARILAQSQASGRAVDGFAAQLCGIARRRDLSLVISSRTSGTSQLAGISDLRLLDWGMPAI